MISRGWRLATYELGILFLICNWYPSALSTISVGAFPSQTRTSRFGIGLPCRITKPSKSSSKLVADMVSPSLSQVTAESHRDKPTVTFSSVFLPDDPNEQDSPIIEGESVKGKTALIILNSPIPRPPSRMFQRLWDLSSVHICADGGANRLYEATARQAGANDTSRDDAMHNNKNYIPHRIRGDLDSLQPHVRDHYASLGTHIEGDKCQDTNDLDKTLQVCRNDVSRVLVYGAFGGRFDQEMASIQAMYKWCDTFNNQIYLYTDETCAFLLPAETRCEIRMPFYNEHTPSIEESNYGDATSTKAMKIVGEGPTCGLIPIGCRVDSIKTSGLKWDLDGNMPLEFGGFVSSSNRIMEPVLTVESSQPVVFTAEITSL